MKEYTKEPRKPCEAAQESLPEDMIEGRNAVTEALRSGRTINKVFLADGDTDRALGRLAAMAKESGAVVVRVDRRKLNDMSPTGAHQGIMAAVAAHEGGELLDALQGEGGQGEGLLPLGHHVPEQGLLGLGAGVEGVVPPPVGRGEGGASRLPQGQGAPAEEGVPLLPEQGAQAGVRQGGEEGGHLGSIGVVELFWGHHGPPFPRKTEGKWWIFWAIPTRISGRPPGGRGRGGGRLSGSPQGRAQEAGPGGVFSTILEKPWRVKAGPAARSWRLTIFAELW